MGGKGESVGYTRFFYAQMDDKKKAELKRNVERIINLAQHSLTIIVLEGKTPLQRIEDYKDFP